MTRAGRCRLCGAEGPVEPVMIPEDLMSNKLAVLDLCPACKAERRR